jgi:hypothetical protein
VCEVGWKKGGPRRCDELPIVCVAQTRRAGEPGDCHADV